MPSSSNQPAATDSGPATAIHVPLVAAVIIGRNEEAFIGPCIASVLRALAPFDGAETIFVDSRSTDRTCEIARGFPIKIVELSPSIKLSPALGRLVGERLTRSQHVLFVDGDTEIDADWLQESLAFLTSHDHVGGVCGKLREVYYTNGAVVGGHPDCFFAADSPAEVEDPGGNAVYRRSSLEAAGSFNPYLTSYEEAELTGRLRQAGFTVVRLPVVLGTHHTGLRGSLGELRRRYRDNLIRGYGQALRASLGTPLLKLHVRRQKRYLQFQAVAVLGILTALASLISGDMRWFGGWCALGVAFIAAFMLKSRSLTKPFVLIADWSVWSIPLALGFFETPQDPRAFSVDQAVESVEAGTP